MLQINSMRSNLATLTSNTKKCCPVRWSDLRHCCDF